MLKKLLIKCRDITTPLRWWAESAPLSYNRIKVSENGGATAVAPVPPVVTSINNEDSQWCYPSIMHNSQRSIMHCMFPLRSLTCYFIRNIVS